MPKKTPVSTAVLPVLSEDGVDSQEMGVGSVEAITMMMQQMMRQQVEQVSDLNRKLEEIGKKKKSKKASAAVAEKRILAKAKLLYYYDIRDKKVTWAEAVLVQIEGMLQENPRLWDILDREIPTEVLKKLTYKHFDSDVPENIRKEYMEKARVEIQESK